MVPSSTTRTMTDRMRFRKSRHQISRKAATTFMYSNEQLERVVGITWSLIENS